MCRNGKSGVACSLLALTAYVTATMIGKIGGGSYHLPSDHWPLTSHGVSETRLLGEPGAEHAAGATSPHHPPPGQRK